MRARRAACALLACAQLACGARTGLAEREAQPAMDAAVPPVLEPDAAARRDARRAPRDVPTLADGAPAPVPVALALGAAFSCARMADGTVWCWGSNNQGQLGDGLLEPRAVPAPVIGLTGVEDLAAGPECACARLRDESVWCWGGNRFGRLGDGTTVSRRRPARVEPLRGVRQLAFGDGHACGIFPDGALRCWGNNEWNQLGTGEPRDSLVPVAPAGLGGPVAAVRAGAFHTCAVMADGAVRCWGQNTAGQAGHEQGTRERATPARVNGLAPVALVAASSESCAAQRGAGVACWGTNDVFQRGTEAPRFGSMPTPVPGVSAVTELVAGWTFYCALDADARAVCWGANGAGQLGRGAFESGGAPPGAVVGPGAVAHLAAGRSHACALTTTGEVLCWGNNGSYQLAQPTLEPRATPVRVVF